MRPILIAAFSCLFVHPNVAMAQPSPPGVSIVVLTPGASGDRAGGELSQQAEGLFESLRSEGRLAYRKSSVDPAGLSSCLGGEIEPTDARRQCLRRSLPAQEYGVPVVVVVVNYTMERGAWQRMECVGASAAGFVRTVYIQDFDHPRADVRASPRNAGLRCVLDAIGPDLREIPASSDGEDAQAALRLAELNWTSCLEQQTGTLALRAVDAGRPPPSPSEIFEACSSQEALLSMEVERKQGGTEMVERRDMVSPSISAEIRRIFSGYNYR